MTLQLRSLSLSLQVLTHLQDSAFDRACRLEYEHSLPPGNIFPPSFYLIKKILGFVDLDNYEWNVCSCGGTAWPPLCKEQWLQNS